ncbi:hypothetical protein LX59_02992 [Azomonas agilis]|uniref:Strictosidine synthase n=1 Tax=Azomonas agilis TaxID=116849 RepID=A0A562HZS5_9GAMM|nr:hypothetical protein [Azomonas agilis]TWH63928.1 hypothetical protein LX59_02992 [Azomonas agilis]
MRALIKINISLALLLTISTATFFAWQHFYPVTPHSGWSYQERLTDIQSPGAILLDSQKNIIVTEELTKSRGKIWKINPEGLRQLLVDNLSKPDGLALYNEGIVFSQEAGPFPVNLLRDGKIEPLFNGTNVQTLTVEGEYLYAIEDRKGYQGRLLQYHAKTNSLNILRDNLDEAEALVICPDGQRFYTEKDRGLVKKFSEDGQDSIYLQGLHQPGSLFCDAQGLWVSEDRNHRARLLLRKPNGELQTILSFLKSPQVLHPIAPGHYLLAEGGRDRILELKQLD